MGSQPCLTTSAERKVPAQWPKSQLSAPACPELENSEEAAAWVLTPISLLRSLGYHPMKTPNPSHLFSEHTPSCKTTSSRKPSRLHLPLPPNFPTFAQDPQPMVSLAGWGSSASAPGGQCQLDGLCSGDCGMTQGLPSRGRCRSGPAWALLGQGSDKPTGPNGESADCQDLVV